MVLQLENIKLGNDGCPSEMGTPNWALTEAPQTWEHQIGHSWMPLQQGTGTTGSPTGTHKIGHSLMPLKYGKTELSTGGCPSKMETPNWELTDASQMWEQGQQVPSWNTPNWALTDAP